MKLKRVYIAGPITLGDQFHRSLVGAGMNPNFAQTFRNFSLDLMIGLESR